MGVESNRNTADFLGFSKSELRGLRWEGLHDGIIEVTQSVWRTTVNETKNEYRRAEVPVIEPLQLFLDIHRTRVGNPTTGYLFAGRAGQSLNLDNLAARVIRPALEGTNVTWQGWHAVHRGLATNLHRLGIPPGTIQRILRHSNYDTTMNRYVRAAGADAKAAMKQLEKEICTKMHLDQCPALKSGVVN